VSVEGEVDLVARKRGMQGIIAWGGVVRRCIDDPAVNAETNGIQEEGNVRLTRTVERHGLFTVA
jgi:hypothetical protein